MGNSADPLQIFRNTSIPFECTTGKTYKLYLKPTNLKMFGTQ